MERVQRHLWLAPVLLGLVAGVFAMRWLVAEVGPAHIDLQVYRFAVDAWRDGRDIYGTLPATADNRSLPFIYPPFALLPLLPFGLLGYDPAVVALFTLNLLCLAVTLYVVARRVAPRLGVRGALAVTALAGPAALLLEPVNATFRFGQINLVLMALVAVDCLAPLPRWARGIGVGLAAAIKLTPAAFVLYFLLHKDFRATATAVVTGAVAVGIGFALAPGASVQYWFGGLAGASDVGGVPFLTNQSLDAVVARFGLPAPAATALWLGLVAVVLVAVVLGMRRAEPATALLLNAALALLASPTSWSHYWIWVAPALLVLGAGVVRHARARSPLVLPWAGAAVAAALLCGFAPFNDLPGFDNRELLWTPWQQVVGASYPILGTVLVLAYALPALRRSGARPGSPIDAQPLDPAVSAR